MNSPLITIVTITFNAEKELPRTMDSVLEQSYKNFEHLIIDGASTDRTLEIARRNPDARILSEKDKGLYDAMNKGLANARGEYILFLNAGDTFRSPDVLAMYANAAEKGYDIIYADTMIVDEEGNDTGPRHYSAPELLTFESFSKGMLVCHQAFMVRRQITPQYDLQYRFSADYDWTIKCIRNTEPEKCRNLQTVAINYLSNGMTDKNKFKSLRERFRVMADHYGLAKTIKRHIALLAGKR
ncbi:MAG: glycosyltransferase [Muribaculaceae bacterium]|nr:glycosyltransferase [Muribaculaceae bacterium]